MTTTTTKNDAPGARGPKLPRGGRADVTLLLEGTYPFVRGGVSSWVHDIVRGLPDLRFSLVFLGGDRGQYPELRYELPKNVVHLEEHYLGDVPKHERITRRRGDGCFFARSRALHDAFETEDAELVAKAADDALAMLAADPEGTERDFLFSERAWETIVEKYRERAPDKSFLDWFWSVRAMHAPLFVAARAARGIPPSRLFHVVSTGFAGFLGTLLARSRKRPLILTEHGIYTKERRIELLQATWLKEDDTRYGAIGQLRRTWIRYFEHLARMAYATADPIVSLYGANRERQIRDGADPGRTLVVPNGIDIARFEPLRAMRTRDVPRVLGLVGRVVPIKDIKTFIRAMQVVAREMPDAEGWIVGPDNEDPSYAQECRDLARSLGLDGRVKFLGFRKVEEILPKLGVNVLTSISEAQPLSILEGFAAGLPSIATDVGCCSELIHGADEGDRALGSAGAVVPIADPEATARAAIELLSDQSRFRAAQAAGIARVERSYTNRRMLDRYRGIYGAALAREYLEPLDEVG